MQVLKAACSLVLLLVSGWAAAGQAVVVKNVIGTELNAYVAGPENSPVGLLILHDRWGLNDTVRAWVDRYGSHGYRTLAIDVFDDRQTHDQRDRADAILKSTDPEMVKSNVLAGLRYLQAPNRKLATLGAGFGGWQSFQAAVLAPEQVTATVAVYASLDADVEQVRELKGAVLALFATDDERVTAAMREDYRIKMKKGFISYRTKVYDSAPGFLDPLYPSYSTDLAQDVWGEIDRFLLGVLGK